MRFILPYQQVNFIGNYIPCLQNRMRGCLYGLATGDALGTTLEFKTPGTFEPIDDMVGGGPFNLGLE